MYYEEKIINGVLMCRHKPNGDWEQCSITVMGERLIKQQDTIDKLRGQLQNAANHLQRAANRYDKNGAYMKALEQANKALYETVGA